MTGTEPLVSSKRPYLLRAMHEWISDNGQTPHIVVDATQDGVRVPEAHVEDGRIVLNISYQAANSIRLENDLISFRARFGGQPFEVSLPVAAVIGIYARETGQGMLFSESGSDDDPEPPKPAGDDESADSSRAHLTVVK